jgi:Domain of Unknown Function (DUF928)
MFKSAHWGLSIAVVSSFLTSILPPVAIAQSIPTRWAAKRYKVPTVGSPLRREAAATRGNCPADPFLAIAPKDAITVTKTAYPTLFFSVPTVPKGDSLPLEFKLKDGTKTVYQTKLQLTGNRQIVSISLPSTSKLAPLTIDRDYDWSAIIRCSNDSESANLIVTGMIRRITPDAELTAKLKAFSQVEPSQRQLQQLPSIYAEAEIWQDALMELVNLRRLQPKNPQVFTQWQSLLKSVDLETIVNDPLSPVP